VADLCNFCHEAFVKVRSDQLYCTRPECRAAHNTVKLTSIRKRKAESKAKMEKQVERHCSNCGAVMGSGHIKFGRECRAAAGVPAYVIEKQNDYRFMEAVNG
jgi:hypothetical protein